MAATSESFSIELFQQFIVDSTVKGTQSGQTSEMLTSYRSELVAFVPRYLVQAGHCLGDIAAAGGQGQATHDPLMPAKELAGGEELHRALTVEHVLSLAKRMVDTMRLNIAIALFTVAVLLVGVLFGGVTMAIGMLVHEASVLLVIVIAMLLRPTLKPHRPGTLT